ncbi:P-loop containing nucleoside triphosphate hydrolase protein, partial [Apiospora phragmitis]
MRPSVNKADEAVRGKRSRGARGSCDANITQDFEAVFIEDRRSIGVIIKPDTLDSGSESKSLDVSLGRKLGIDFGLSCEVLKNTDSKAGKTIPEKRNKQDAASMSQGVRQQLPGSDIDIEQLRSCLRTILPDHAALGLPALISEIERKHNACKEKLDELGLPRGTLHEQRLHLLQISESFQRIAKSATDGNCSGLFFEVGDDAADGFECRIRAVVQDLNKRFADELMRKGHRHDIINSPGPTSPIRVTRDEFVEYIGFKLSKLDGCELPIVLNPLAIGNLFRDQSTPWGKLTNEHVKKVGEACKKFLGLAATHVADGAGTAAAIFQNILEPSMDRILRDAQEQTEHILKTHRNIHPITYNHSLMSSIDKLRTKRYKTIYNRTLERFFEVSEAQDTVDHAAFDLDDLVDALLEGTAASHMARATASNALDILEAYYEYRHWVVEVRLVSALADILSPVGVYQMEPALVSSVAGESEECRALRAQLTKELEILTQAARTCKPFETVACT